MRSYFAGLLIFSLAGCSQLYEPKPFSVPVEDNTIFSKTAAVSGTLVLDRDTPYVTCSEPPPDAAFSQGEAGAFAFSLLNFGGSDSGEESEDSEELEMSGRTPGTLIVREIFFRTCEFSRNYRLNKDEAKDLYLKSLDTVAAGWRAEAGNTNVTIGETANHTINQTFTGNAHSIGQFSDTSASTSVSSPEESEEEDDFFSDDTSDSEN